MDRSDQQSDVLKELSPLIPDIKNMILSNTTNEDLLNAINENTKICRELLSYLKENNKKTDKIHDWVEVELTPEQQLKDLGLNLLANIAGNAINMQNLINIGNKK